MGPELSLVDFFEPGNENGGGEDDGGTGRGGKLTGAARTSGWTLT